MIMMSKCSLHRVSAACEFAETTRIFAGARWRDEPSRNLSLSHLYISRAIQEHNMMPTTVMKLGLIAATALVAGLSSGPVDARTLQEIMSSKVIRLGTVPYPPMTQLDSRTGSYNGLWVEGPKFLFEQLGLK